MSVDACMTLRRLVSILGLLGWPHVGEAQSPRAVRTLSPAVVSAVQDSVRSFMSRHGIPGLSIAIAVDGQLAWSSGFGLADLENAVPALASTVYRTASIGKPMTAVAALQLAASGKLNLDAPIERYCPVFPKKRWPITARHLLAHTSGIRHYGGPRGAEEQLSAVHYESVESALTVFRDDSLLFEPGTRYLYSTYGYTLLGCVIEGAAHEPFMSYMQREVFAPARMQQTRADNPFALIFRRSRGYRRDPAGELTNSPFADLSNKMPAGGYVTTVEDLVRFALACSDGTLLQAATWNQMASPFMTRQRKVLNERYGLGWGLDSIDGELEVFHGGQTPHVTGILALLPRRRFAVAVLMNLEGVENRRQLTDGIARVVLGAPS